MSSIYSIVGNGLNTASVQFARTAQKIASPDGLDNLAQNAANLSSEKTSFEANALVLKMANRMTGTLLDILDTDRP